MTVARSVENVLAEYVVFEVEFIDRSSGTVTTRPTPCRSKPVSASWVRTSEPGIPRSSRTGSTFPTSGPSNDLVAYDH